MKKVFALALSLCLICGATSAFAQENLSERTTLGEFISTDQTWVTSVSIVKVTDPGWTEVECMTDDSKEIAAFLEWANSVSMTVAETQDQYYSREGYYITVIGTSEGTERRAFAFVNAGGVDRYSLVMSRNPRSLYTLDDKNALAELERFYNGFEGKIADDWALSEINRAIEFNILPKELQCGYMENITREHFCDVINGMIMLDGFFIPVSTSAEGEYDFADCKNPAVLYLRQLGIISGKGGNLFDPKGSLTRQEAAVILYRLMKLYELKVDTQSKGIGYSDFDRVAAWAKDGVNAVTDAGIMIGDGSYFLPNDKYTHQQAIATVMRLYDRILATDTKDRFHSYVLRLSPYISCGQTYPQGKGVYPLSPPTFVRVQ